MVVFQSVKKWWSFVLSRFANSKLKANNTRHLREEEEEEEEEGRTIAIEKLTPDLTIDILSRLPIRSLLRGKCVCKSWRTLISEPLLSTLHLNRSSINNDVIFHTYPNDIYGKRQLYFSEQPSLLEENIFTKKIDLSLFTGMERLQILLVGTCNGLLCLAARNLRTSYIPKSFYILNPITGEHQQLPDFGTIYSKNPISMKHCFGFDDDKNVFKVVVFLSHLKDKGSITGIDDMDFVNEMQIWTTGLGRDNRWRRQLGNVPNVLLYRACFAI